MKQLFNKSRSYASRVTMGQLQRRAINSKIAYINAAKSSIATLSMLIAGGCLSYSIYSQMYKSHSLCAEAEAQTTPIDYSARITFKIKPCCHLGPGE